MDFNGRKLKKFLLNSLRGKKKPGIERDDDVRWKAVPEEDKGEAFEERESFEPVASFPEEVTERTRFIADASAPGDDVQITRASVYVPDDDGPFRTNKETQENHRIHIHKVNCSSGLADMDEAALTFSESESSVDDFVGEVICRSSRGEADDFSGVKSKPSNRADESNFDEVLYGPGSSRGAPFPSASAPKIENIILSEEPRSESGNSLNIQKELDELIGALYVDVEVGKTPDFLNEVDDFDGLRDSEEGSRINFAFARTEVEGGETAGGFPGSEPKLRPTSPDYWTDRRIKSVSFAGRFAPDMWTRRGKQRMSMVEAGSRARGHGSRKRGSGEPRIWGITDSEDSRALFEGPARVEGEERWGPADASSRLSLPSGPPTARLQSDGDCIDWSWLEEATKSLDLGPCERRAAKSASLRVDAGCQTQPDDPRWEGEAGGEPCPAASESVAGESRGGAEEMPRKFTAGGSAAGGASAWLRYSMRRIRHFDLEDPSRIRSAPPDALRPRLEVAESESTANQAVACGGRATAGNEVAEHGRRPRSEESRAERRGPSARTRPSSAPCTRSFRGGASAPRRPDAETPASPAPGEPRDNSGYESDSADRHPSPRGGRRRAEEEFEEAEGRSPLGPWPHGLSSVLAGLGCTLGLFNISRFAVLSVHFGCNFILQFLVLSLLLGVPLLAFHAALGQTLGAGPVDMWKISPFFQGIGIALLLAQALVGMYSIVGVSWMFVYFRDSFITKQDAFRWAEPFRHYREDNIFASSVPNGSGRLEETVPDYLNGVVLQRHGLASPENAFGHLKFQLTFNLAVVWMIVFVSLSKGLRSYGKVVYVFSVVPVLGILVMCSKLLGLTPPDRDFFPQTEWSEFFVNPKSWISAVTEVMLTWNLLGAATMQVASHNRCGKKLWRDVAAIALVTVAVLILAAFLGNACHQLLVFRGYAYVPSSFERISTYSFLRPSGAPPPPPSRAVPTRHMTHGSLVAGEKVGKPGAFHESGYQVARLATELVPATLAVLDGNYLSPFWAVLFYFTLILFGIAQQLAIWHCVITGIMAINAPSLKSWETTITFFTCAAGFILGLPMTTELGIFVVYFLDYCLGGGWWVILLTLMEICAVLMIRGRPYSGENICVALFGKASNCVSLWAVPLLTFAWNVIAPVALLVACITIFKSGGYRDLWQWRCGAGDYWPLWTRRVGVFVQVVPLLCIPVVAVVQSYRYLSGGPADILDRLSNLYRPTTGTGGIDEESATAAAFDAVAADSGATAAADPRPPEDPPPKYTPPPSYSTATGARIAKLLRQSLRRSVRRIRSALGPDFDRPPRLPPPDYASVLVEMNRNSHAPTQVDHHPPDTVNYTAEDVAQVLGCSFRRTNNPNAPTSRDDAENNPIPQNLVTPSHRNR